MYFFTPKRDFTHYGRLHGVPVYVNLDTEEMVVAARNIAFDVLLIGVTVLHNIALEPITQALAAAFHYDYSPGFPIRVGDEIEQPI